MTPQCIVEYRISDHAREELRRRQISGDHVRGILSAPEQVLMVREGRKVFQSRVFLGEEARLYLFRVFVDTDRQPPEVVTAYRTSKVEKYWERAE